MADRRRRDRRRLSAGAYLAFSTFVMPGLRKLPPAHAISAMNSINKAAPSNPLLMLVLFGTGIVCVLVMIAGFQHKGDPAAVWQIAGAALYLVSALILVGYHVPPNDQLMKVDPNAAGAGACAARIFDWMADLRLRQQTAATSARSPPPTSRPHWIHCAATSCAPQSSRSGRCSGSPRSAASSSPTLRRG